MLVYLQLFKISATAVSRPTVDTHLSTDNLLRPRRTFGSSATRAFRHQRLRLTVALARTYRSVDGGISPSAITVGPTGLWMGGAHTTSRSKIIFGITAGVWNAPAWSRHGANSLDYDSDTGPVLPDLDSGCSVLCRWPVLMCCHPRSRPNPFSCPLIIGTEDNKTLLPHIDRSWFRRRNYVYEIPISVSTLNPINNRINTNIPPSAEIIKRNFAEDKVNRSALS